MDKNEMVGEVVVGQSNPDNGLDQGCGKSTPFEAQGEIPAAPAPLHAAAPDMFYALKAVDALWTIDAGAGFAEEMSIPSPVGVVWEKVRAAIAKATGAA